MKSSTIAYPLIVSLIWLVFLVGKPAFASMQQDLWITQTWLEDSTFSLTPAQAMRHFAEGKGRPVRTKVFRLGSKETQIWLLLSAANLSSQASTYRLLTGLPHSRLFRARLIVPGQTVEDGSILIDENDRTRFQQRINDFRLLNSNEFVIGPDETIAVLVQAAIRGPSYLPLSLVSPDEFNALRLRDAVFASQFYVFEATLGVLFLLFGLAVKHRIATLYALMFLLGLLAMADIDGHAFHWLWPNFPVWNSWSPMVVLPLLNALGFVIIHQLLHTINALRFAWCKSGVLVFAAISLFMPSLLCWFPFSALVQAENVLTMLVFMLQPLAFIGWARWGRRHRLTWIALAAISVSLIGMIVPVFFNIELPAVLNEHTHHMVYLLVGLMIMAVITVQLMGIRKDQEAAMARELAFAKHDADMNQALYKAEQKYSEARQAASRHRQQLASASHDLRQPITSLRATIDAIAPYQESSIRRQLQEAFDYLETLCNHYLHETRPASAEVINSTARSEIYSASLILNSVYRMFAEEAASRHIELRLVDCKALLQVPPLAMMRIVSNIVANAIKHHPGGNRARVLIGCRRKKSRLHILVCDNGAGIAPEKVALLQQPYQKTPESEGEGLGLSIVHNLATENGIAVRIESQEGKGSRFVIEVPWEIKPTSEHFDSNSNHSANTNRDS